MRRLISRFRFGASMASVLAISVALVIALFMAVDAVVHFGFRELSERGGLWAILVDWLVWALVFILIAIPVSYATAQRFVRPVKRLSRAAERISRGDLDVHIPLDARRSDEVSELAAAFSVMTRALKESRAQYEKLVAEERQRAAALASANETNRVMLRELELAQERTIQSAKMAAIGQLAAGVAHEINNPLASILGFAQLARYKISALQGKNPDAALLAVLEKYAAYIESEAHRCARVVGKMRSFAYRPGEIDAEPLDVNDLIEQALHLTANQLALAGTKVERRLAQELPPLRGHAASMVQVFTNIIVNATKAMPNAGVLTVTSRVSEPQDEDDGQAVEVMFEDTGVGIPEDIISKVFDPFFTTAQPGDGMGLGLYVCYQIVRSHDGEISVRSKVGEGSAFTVRLPAARSGEPAAAPARGL
ncbi:MAG: ATP-binding protein [Chloroflexi bacterium]|nr:ATP-binding protein [Chloroflexota bacterium]